MHSTQLNLSVFLFFRVKGPDENRNAKAISFRRYTMLQKCLHVEKSNFYLTTSDALLNKNVTQREGIIDDFNLNFIAYSIYVLL